MLVQYALLLLNCYRVGILLIRKNSKKTSKYIEITKLNIYNAEKSQCVDFELLAVLGMSIENCQCSCLLAGDFLLEF